MLFRSKERGKSDCASGVTKGVFSLFVLQELLFLGLRASYVGVDTYGYVFNFLHPESMNERWEPLFKLLNITLRSLTDNVSVYLLVTAALSIIPISVVIYKYSEKPFFSWYVYICMYYFSFNFSGIRQSIAAGFLALAFLAIMEKKYVTAVLMILVASGFHTSALIFLVAIFIRNHKWKMPEYFILAAVYAVIFVFRQQIFIFIISIAYEEYEVVQTNAYTWMLLNVMLLLLLFMLSSRIRNDEILTFSLNLMAVGCAFLLLTSVGDNVLRIANYFTVFMTVAIPNALKKLEKKIEPIVLIMGVVVLAVFYYIHLSGDPYMIIPYRLEYLI